jgi:hypothetical protein
MRRSVVVLCLAFVFWIFGQRTGNAQAVEAADEPGLHLNAGGMASGFQPDEGGNDLVGAGTYVDFHFTHWIQIEGEGRWLRWNQYFGEHEDNYLIGPRVPVYRIGKRGQIYGKALIGLGKMTFPFGGYGTFTALAFGGTLDYRLSRKVTMRAIDFEYQDWPVWLPHQSLQPYGVSVGFAYKVF